MARAHVNQPAHIPVRTHHAAHFMGLQQTGFMAIAQRAQFFSLLGKPLKVARLVGEVAIAPSQVAVNIESLYALANDFHCFKPHQLHLPHAVFADDAFKLLKAVAHAANQLPAVATAGTPADLMCFEQDHAHATLG